MKHIVFLTCIETLALALTASGVLRPLTRGAIADYQRDHSLYVTPAIDGSTLQSFGMA